MAEPPTRRARMNNPDVFPIISEEYAASIGHVAIAWAMLENTIAYCVGTLVTTTDAVRIAITAELPHLAMMNVLASLVDLRRDDTKLVESWKSLRATIEGLRQIRNSIIHADWRRFEDHHFTTRFQSKGRVTQADTIIKKEYLDEIANKIVEAVDGVHAFLTLFLASGGRKRLEAATVTPASPLPTPTKLKKAPRPPKLSSAQKRRMDEAKS